MTRYVTNSELQTFKDCRRKWWLSTYRKLTPKKKPIQGPLGLGTRVHNALETLYTGGDPIASYKALADADRILWRNQFEADGLAPNDADAKAFENELELGQIMVLGYLEWIAETGADADFELVGAEQKIDVPFLKVHGQEVRLLGKLDKRVRRKRDDARLFIDHKTCGSIDQWLQTARMNEQFLMYQLLERLAALETGETVNTQGSMVNLLRKVKRTAQAKPPFYHREEVHHSDEELRRFYLRLIGEIDDLIMLEQRLKDGADPLTVAYPRPSRDCTWKCEFKHVCPMFDDGSDAERFLEDHFERYDPLTRYDDKEQEV